LQRYPGDVLLAELQAQLMQETKMSGTNDKAHIKAALEAAHAEIGKAVASLDQATPAQLAQLKVGARQLSAFVDFHNGGCASAAGLTSSELLGKIRT
jgi:hypothetical protein